MVNLFIGGAIALSFYPHARVASAAAVAGSDGGERDGDGSGTRCRPSATSCSIAATCEGHFHLDV
jgi:hypothetical protein